MNLVEQIIKAQVDVSNLSDRLFMAKKVASGDVPILEVEGKAYYSHNELKAALAMTSIDRPQIIENPNAKALAKELGVDWGDRAVVFKGAPQKRVEYVNGQKKHVMVIGLFTRCSIVINGQERIVNRQLRDKRNQPIAINEITDNDIASALSRTEAKAIAEHVLNVNVLKSKVDVNKRQSMINNDVILLEQKLKEAKTVLSQFNNLLQYNTKQEVASEAQQITSTDKTLVNKELPEETINDVKSMIETLGMDENRFVQVIMTKNYGFEEGIDFSTNGADIIVHESLDEILNKLHQKDGGVTPLVNDLKKGIEVKEAAASTNTKTLTDGDAKKTADKINAATKKAVEDNASAGPYG